MSEITPVDDDYYELTGALANMLRVIGDDQSCLEGELNEAISVLIQYLDYDEYRACRAIEQIEAHTARLPMDTDIPEVDQHVAAFWHARDQLRNHFVALVELVAPDGWLDSATDAEWARFRSLTTKGNSSMNAETTPIEHAGRPHCPCGFEDTGFSDNPKEAALSLLAEAVAEHRPDVDLAALLGALRGLV